MNVLEKEKDEALLFTSFYNGIIYKRQSTTLMLYSKYCFNECVSWGHQILSNYHEYSFDLKLYEIDFN